MATWLNLRAEYIGVKNRLMEIADLIAPILLEDLTWKQTQEYHEALWELNNRLNDLKKELVGRVGTL